MKIVLLQKIIDILRNKKPLSFYTFDKLLQKIQTFIAIKEKITTIIFGSSHAEYGYIADSNEMNLGISYQDLYYSYKLYEKYNNSNIKNVILFYSVFSPGAQLIKTNDARESVCYKLVCDIPYQYKNIARQKNLYKIEKQYAKQCKKLISKFKCNENYHGNEISYITYFSNIPAKDRALGHYKNNQRINNQNKYVIQIAKEALNNNQKFYIVIPPATEEYKSFLPSSDELFKELYEIAKTINNIYIINCYDLNFSKDLFVDFDHLNYNGAIKLTSFIKEITNKS